MKLDFHGTQAHSALESYTKFVILLWNSDSQACSMSYMQERPAKIFGLLNSFTAFPQQI